MTPSRNCLEDFLCDQNSLDKHPKFLKDYVDNEIQLIEQVKEQNNQL